MKIAVLTSWLPGEGHRGGVGYQAHRLSNMFVKRGHQVDVFTATERPADALYNTKRIASDAEAKNRFFMIYGLAVRYARCDYRDYDVIHAHGDSQWLPGRCRVVRTFHGSALGEALSSRSAKRFMSQLSLYPCEVLAARRASVAVGVSEVTRRHIPGISAVIPCGVDLSEFYPGKKSAAPSILFVGDLNGRKRGAWLARLFLERIKPVRPDAELWMVSEPGEPAEGIRWCGKPETADLTELYRKAWVFCLPSTYEGFGIPYIEAMASGTCVVASPNGGAIEVLNGGEYGIVAEDRVLGAAILELLGSVEKRVRLVERGMARAETFSYDFVVQQYEEVYRQLASEPHHV